VRDFQSVIGKETREQMLEMEGRLPDALVACIGGGSNAIGLFHPFLDDKGVAIYGVEAAGHGLDVHNGHCASISGGRPGVLHGNRTYLLQDADGQILEGHSISAGLDYPGIGPEHSWLKESGRVTYVSATDKEALDAFQLCTRTEGIIPALEPAHALAYVSKLAPKLPKDNLLVMNMCGRGSPPEPGIPVNGMAGRWVPIPIAGQETKDEPYLRAPSPPLSTSPRAKRTFTRRATITYPVATASHEALAKEAAPPPPCGISS
jgi:tryptophan synthase beta subunit